MRDASECGVIGLGMPQRRRALLTGLFHGVLADGLPGTIAGEEPGASVGSRATSRASISSNFGESIT